jgi:predicted DNA binding protein
MGVTAATVEKHLRKAARRQVETTAQAVLKALQRQFFVVET